MTYFNKEKYTKNGYQQFEPYEFVDQDFVEKLNTFFNKKFLNYSDNPTYRNIKAKYNDEVIEINKVKYSGWSENQILFRNQYDTFNNFLDENILYGKRGVLDVKNIDDPVVKIIEEKKIIKLAQFMLDREDIVFLNGSFAVSYPGNLGEGKRVHSDMAAFNNNKKIESLFSKNIHNCNIMIYLSDVDQNTAPMRVLPESHKKYNEYNKIVSKSLGTNISKAYMPQAHILFDEVLPEHNYEHLTGGKGTVVAMNSFLIHAATKNFSNKLSRKVIILNYAPKNEGLIKVGMSNVKNTALYNNISNKKLFDYNVIDYKTLKTRTKKVINFIKIGITKIVKLNFLRTIIAKIKFNYFKNYKKNKKRLCLNIGSGAGWHHPNFINLNAIIDKSSLFSIKQDFTKNKKLPFPESSLEAIYSSHCFEHFVEKDFKDLLKECKRVLRKNGCLRIVVPNIKLFFDSYENKDMSFISWMKDSEYYKYDSWLRLISRMIAEPIINRFEDDELYKIYSEKKDYKKFCDFLIDEQKKLLEEGAMNNNFFPDNHKNYFTDERITDYLTETGFNNIEISSSNKSKYKFFRNTRIFKNLFDKTRPDMSMYVECQK